MINKQAGNIEKTGKPRNHKNKVKGFDIIVIVGHQWFVYGSNAKLANFSASLRKGSRGISKYFVELSVIILGCRIYSSAPDLSVL